MFEFRFGFWKKVQLVSICIVAFFCGMTVLVDALKEWNTARCFPAPVAISLPDLIRQHPTEGWYKISGGVLTLARCATHVRPGSDGYDKVTAYVPLLLAEDFQAHPMDDSHVPPTYVVVHTYDRELLDLIERLQEYDDMGDRMGDREKKRLFALVHQGKFVNRSAVTGTLRPPRANEMKELAPLRGLQDHYLIVEAGETPHVDVNPQITLGLLLTLVPLSVGSVWLFLWWRLSQDSNGYGGYGGDSGDGGFTAIYSDGSSALAETRPHTKEEK